MVVGVTVGPATGCDSALAGGAVFLLAAALCMIFVAPIDYAECEELFREVSNESCRGHSDLGWAVFFLVGAMCGGALSLSVTAREPRPMPDRRTSTSNAVGLSHPLRSVEG